MHDVIIIGGGVIGLTLAYELTQRKLDVAVYDQGSLGQEASWAGAGIIAPGNPAGAVTAEAQLRAGSAALWPSFSAKLQAETGVDNGFRPCGGLELRLVGKSTDLDDEIAHWQHEQVAVERLSPHELKDCEPQISSTITSAYRLPSMGQVRNPRHIKALLAACAARGVTLRPGTPVLNLHQQGELVTGIETSAGCERAGEYVIASGAWSSRLLATAGCAAPVRPVRGQIVLLNAVPLLFRHVINVGPRYLVPRPDGRILIGATEEDVGFEKRNTPAGVRGLLEFATSVVPALERATFERAWSGLRPGSADGLPYLGRLPGKKNLSVAAGHFRQGLHLSPITGQLLAQVLLHEATSLPMKPYAPDRS